MVMVVASPLVIEPTADAYALADTLFGEGVAVISACYAGNDCVTGLFRQPDRPPDLRGATPALEAHRGILLSSLSERALRAELAPAGGEPGPGGAPEPAAAAHAEGDSGSGTAILLVDFVPESPVVTLGFTCVLPGRGLSAEEREALLRDADMEAISCDWLGIRVNGARIGATRAQDDGAENDLAAVQCALNLHVQPGQVNTLAVSVGRSARIAGAALLFAAGSIQSVLQAREGRVRLEAGKSHVVDVLHAYRRSGPQPLVPTGPDVVVRTTARLQSIMGQTVVAGDCIRLAGGEEITLNHDGTLTVRAADLPGASRISYVVRDSGEQSHIGNLVISTVPLGLGSDGGSGFHVGVAPGEAGRPEQTVQAEEQANPLIDPYRFANAARLVAHRMTRKPPGDAASLSGSVVATLFGAIALEDLQVGDMVLTRDHGYQPVRWIGRRRLSAEEMRSRSHLCPIRIAVGALGLNQPDHELIVLPTQRLLLSNAQAELLFGEYEVLVAAADLVGQPGVEIVGPGEAESVHLLFDQHELFCLNGAWCESVLPDRDNLAILPPALSAELLESFPELQGDCRYDSARMHLSRYEARLLFTRAAG